MKSGANLNQCKQLRSAILNALTGPQRDRVAAYANASVHFARDWVPILTENAPQGEVATRESDFIKQSFELNFKFKASSPRPGTCSNMILGMDIEFLYANTGVALKPQSKIIGVKFIYRAPQEISFRVTSQLLSDREYHHKYFI